MNYFIRTMILALVLVAFGCERGAQRVEEPAPAEPSEAATTAKEAAAQEPVAEEEAGESEACQRDADCKTYFRCIDDVCTTPPAISGDVREDTPVAVFEVNGEERARFHLELAVSTPEKTRGLMYRREMLDDWGMLFVYPSDGPRSFWMKNTLIPLDMVFIADRGEVVGIIEGAEPMTLSPRRVDKPARYVLELTAGTAAKSGVVPGAIMKLENAPDSIQPNP